MTNPLPYKLQEQLKKDFFFKEKILYLTDFVWGELVHQDVLRNR
jgi:hypothetical protein